LVAALNGSKTSLNSKRLPIFADQFNYMGNRIPFTAPAKLFSFSGEPLPAVIISHNKAFIN